MLSARGEPALRELAGRWAERLATAPPSLADLCAIHGADTLIVTGADDFTSDKDRAQTNEVDATRQELVRRGSRFVWHDTLEAATRDAIARTEAGDLILLIGAQGMDEGKALMEGSLL